jgi:predicted NAD/FAD-binding protein
MQGTTMSKETIAIIGSGIAGLGSAYFLHKKYDVTVFEKDTRPGGHSHTITVKEDDREIPIDTAVMIFNQNNYPYLCRLLRELDVPTRRTAATISFQHIPSGTEFVLPNMKQTLSHRPSVTSKAFWLLLKEIVRFGRMAPEVLRDERYASYTIGEYLKEKKLSDDFAQKYLVPFAASLWLADQKMIMQFPIVTLVQYFDNHHLLSPTPKFTRKGKGYAWRTFVGGTKVYRDKLIRLFPESVRLHTPVTKVRRLKNGVEVTTQAGKPMQFDRVIFACHADEALALLADPTPLEKELLGAFTYKANDITLHTDRSVMPQSRRVWGAFNARSGKSKRAPLEQNYYVNLLQSIQADKDYFLAVGNDAEVDPALILQKFSFTHPVYTVEASRAQSKLPMLNRDRTYFCGSYFRYAFHEDALVSAINVCRTITGEDIWGDTV